MSKIKKTETPVIPAAARQARPDAVQIIPDFLSADLAIGTLVLALSILVLVLINFIVVSVYHPDLSEIIAKAAPISLFNSKQFHPEPVERLQFHLSLLLIPLLTFGFFSLLGRHRSFFAHRHSLSKFINYSAFGLFLVYFSVLLVTPLPQLKAIDKVNAYYFEDLLIGKYTFPALIVYLALAYVFLLYKDYVPARPVRLALGVLSYAVVAWVIYDIILYNSFPLEVQIWGTAMETNAVFYSITQVFAGKSLLVDFNAQYGLYAWMLCPLFKVIGLSTTHFTSTMAVLNGCSFLLLFLGIRKLIKGDVFALTVFLCLVFWQYWHMRVAIEEASNPDYYYQYWPIRLLFPCLDFYLFTSFIASGPGMRKFLLPTLTLVAAFGVLWNLDSGLVAFGATGIGLIVAAIHNAQSTQNAIAAGIRYTAWWAASMVVVLALFFISTRIHSGHWPELAKFTAFQQQFYISGFYMLPMVALHFWNVPAMVYIIACIYCLFSLRKAGNSDLPVIAFLVVLGMGLFAYFQGRSYGLTLIIVMYPAVIIAGLLCNKILLEKKAFKLRFHEAALFFVIPFIFLADGALSIVFYTPAAHAAAINNATASTPDKRAKLDSATTFITAHLHPKDTAVILAKDYESYYYALGGYHNPINVAGSSEMFLVSEFYGLLDYLNGAKYPVIYDANHVWANVDTILGVLARNYTIADQLPDHSMLYLRPLSSPRSGRLNPGKRTLYYDALDDFRKYTTIFYQIELPDSFSIELLLNLDSVGMPRNQLVFSDHSVKSPSCGIALVQYGPDLRHHIFYYGDGKALYEGVAFDLNLNTENRLLIRFRKDKVAAYVNGELKAVSPRLAGLKNSEGNFFINGRLNGKVHEVLISAD